MLTGQLEQVSVVARLLTPAMPSDNSVGVPFLGKCYGQSVCLRFLPLKKYL